MFWQSSKAQSTIAELFAAAAATFLLRQLFSPGATTVFAVKSTQGVGEASTKHDDDCDDYKERGEL